MQSFRDSGGVLQALIYADVFDYPLTGDEIWQWLVGVRAGNKGRVKKQITELGAKKVIKSQGNYFFLKGREKIVELRKKREKWSEEKLILAQKVAEKIGRLPGIKTVGVTGALSVHNAKEDDDIDLLIISSADSLWLTRLLILLLAPVLGIKRRKPKDKNIKDKICLNLFLDESHLKIEPENLFLAHEICQVRPLINKDKTYEKFLWGNRWIKKYLPNAIKITSYQDNKLTKKSLIANCQLLITFLNKLAFSFQYQYMKPKMTKEKISLHQAFFHPLDLEPKILRQYEEKLKDLTILQ